MKSIKTILITVFTLLLTQIAIANSTNDDSLNKSTADCGISKVNDNNGQNGAGGFSTKLTSVIQNNNGTYTIQVLISHNGCGGPSCKGLSHFSIKAASGSYSNVSWNSVTGNTSGNIALSLGNNDPFDGFKLDNVSGIGGGNSGSFTMTYTLSSLQNQQFLAKAGNNYTQLSHFSIAEFQSVLNCLNQNNACKTASNTTSTTSIIEDQTKTLSGNPTGGTWSIVSGGGTISGSTYTPADINTATTVVIKYTIAADRSCAATTSNVSFSVTPKNTSEQCAAIFISQLDGTNGSPNTSLPFVSGTATYPSPLGTAEMSPGYVPASGYRGFDSSYSVVVGGNFTVPVSGGSESEGRVAVGGDFINNKTGTLYGISQSGGGSFVLGAPGTYGLAVDGNIKINGNASSDRIQIGFNAHPTSYTAIAGGTINNPSKLEVTNQVSGTASGLNIASIISEMTSISVNMVSTTTTGSINDLGGGVRELTGGNNDVEIFTLNGVANKDLDPGYIGILKFKNGTIKAGATIVLNVSGKVVISRLQALAGRVNDPTSSAANSDLDALVYNIIWNFYEATNISILTDLNGTIIAPIANLEVNASINGRVYLGGNLTHSGAGSEIHNYPFTGNLSTFCSAVCTSASNTTLTTSIAENQTKTLSGNPTGGTWSIVSGGGTINTNIYSPPSSISSNTTVIVRYTIAADGSCAATTSDVTFTVTKNTVCTQSPTEKAQGFNIFTLESLSLETNETEGSVATGGDLTLLGNYQVATNNPGTFKVNNVPIGLLVGGKVNYQSGNSLQVNQNTYIKIGNSQGSTVWYKDQNNAYSNIRITQNSNYNSSPRISLQANANQLNVSTTNNPVFQSNIIDFSSAFQTLRANSVTLSQATNNAQLTNPNGQSIPNNSLPNQVKINLQNGVNYLNVTGTDLNNVSVFTYNNAPSAAKVLVINVDASGVFNWNVWNQAGVGQQNAPFIIYNFYNTTTLNIEGNSTIEGTIFAPFANIIKSVNNSNIEGQVIGRSFTHSGGEVHSANFTPSIGSCTTVTGVAPTSVFTVNNNEQCFNSNEFVFNNTSNTGASVQTADPITYVWNFGDSTSSTLMNPTKTYSVSETYTVSLTATNTFGTNTSTKQIVVLANTAPILTETKTTTGTGSITKEVTLTNNTAFSQFSWALAGDGSNLFQNQSTVSFTFSQAGTYNVTVTAIKNGCTSSETISFIVTSNEVTTGNSGGLESESLGDAVTKRYVNRKKHSEPTVFVKSDNIIYNKTKLKSVQPYQGKGQTMLDMFPTELVAGNVAHVTSPTDILDYTVADEVLSVDFSINGKTKGVVLGVKTSDKIYNHTKASCDRLKGAEILSVQAVKLDGYNFLMQGIKQRKGVVEYAISFATAKNNNDAQYSIQTNWYVNNYTKFNDVYNFQVWSTNPTDTQKLVKDILKNLKSYIPVSQTETQKVPKTYAAKIDREKSNLIIKLRSTKKGQNIEISMEEMYSETANNLKHRYNPINSETEQLLKVDISDGYEYDGLVKVDDEIQDAFYHSDGNWGLDYDSKYTEIKEYFVSNNFDREYNDEELAINRNIKIKAVSEYDYLGIYKSLLPGNIPADYSAYKYLSFTAKGSGLMELGLVKSSIENWKAQYRVMVNLSEEEQTYYVPFDVFTSIGTSENITADDLTTLTFTFLPVEANTKILDLTISDVKFTKTAAEGQTIAKIEKFENNFMAYPNPSQGNVNVLLFSKADTNATVSLFDVTGKEIYSAPVQLTVGKNEIHFNVKVKPGMLFLKVNSKEVNYGTSKIIFR